MADILWRMTEDCKSPKIESIKDLWKYLDSVGDHRICGYQKFIDYREHSLEETPLFHLGHDSILELVTREKCLLESEDYKCDAKIEKIIKGNYHDFVEMTNIDEIQTIMHGFKAVINKLRHIIPWPK